jgi:hypothetical protein
VRSRASDGAGERAECNNVERRPVVQPEVHVGLGNVIATSPAAAEQNSNDAGTSTSRRANPDHRASSEGTRPILSAGSSEVLLE